MKKIKLTQGKVALVDDEDFDELNKWKWQCSGKGGYVKRTLQLNGIKSSLIMHRVIMNAPKGIDVDHIDHNKLNNQKTNLRFCTPSQNAGNAKKQKKGETSKYKGVHLDKSRYYKYWIARVRVAGKPFVQRFPFVPEGEILAALCYNEMATEHFGEFAYLNKI